MWNCLKCFNESADSAEYCAYCGSPRAASLENARELATKSAAPHTQNTGIFTSYGEGTRVFPVVVPIVLRLSEAAVRVVSAMIGVLAGVICSVTIYMVADPSNMTGKLFNLREPSGAVPLFTLILFCWGLVICVMRYLRTGAAKRLSADTFLIHSIEIAKVDGLERLGKELDKSTADYSPLLRRLRTLTRHWSITPGLQDADILLQQQLYADEERVRAGYSLVRTFIWALPVIGLLGTVAGVAVAVGGFAEFLRGDIEDVAVIKLSLVNVTAGLSYAFLTTLYGLAGALILMLVTTALQNREEKLYSTIQEKIANVFLPFLQTITPVTKGTEITTTPGLQEQLMTISASVLDYVRQQGTLTLQSFRDERHALHEDVVHWSKLLREEATNGAQNIGQALDRVGMRMSNAQFEFLQKFESIKAGMDQQAMLILESVSGAAQSAIVNQQQILSAISEQQGFVQDNVQLLGELSSVSRESLRLISEINNTLGTFRNLDLDKRATEIVEAIESQRKQLEASLSALHQTSALTNTLLTAQDSLHDSVKKLHETGFEETLREFRNSLTALKPVLENLREPFILQAVPIKANGTTL
jgi:biopolymer transport protein ExbB/TolQ